MNRLNIAIIGAGRVGSTIAFSLIMRNLTRTIMLVDINDAQCTGQVDDLSDALAFSTTSEIYKGSLQEAGQADIAIIAAGIPQKPGQSRIDLLKTNYTIIKNIIAEMSPLRNDLVIIVVTNPVDILTYVVQKNTSLPKNQIFGSGTLLDSLRIQGLIGKKINISQKSVHLYSLGEHGDTQFPAWSSGFIGGVPLLSFANLSKPELEKIAECARNKAYNIIECKGSTAFGVASCVTAYCENIIFNTEKIVPVVCYVEEFDICISMPAILTQRGIKGTIMPPLSHQEKMLLQKSIIFLKKSIAMLEE